MAADRFGPNSAEVERFLERLGSLTPAEWEAIQTAAPPIGSAPEIELSAAPDYFAAFLAATKAAKSEAFPGSETAYFDAMRIAHHRAATIVAGLAGVARLAPRRAAIAEGDDPEAILQLMAEEFENETWERAVNACMIAAGALVVQHSVSADSHTALLRPVAFILDGRSDQGAA
jgi:hypothetical protein